MEFTFESKSFLAKLLAKENIKVEHDNVSTAKFDLRQRVLILPYWQNISENVYDLFVGHEVSHALFTPPDEWKSAIDNGKPNFKPFLNVVEDIRIERKIRTEYPGIKSKMNKGYVELFKQDFFKVKIEEVDQLPFADRLNLKAKIGDFISIQFSEEEVEIMNTAFSADTFEEVVEVAKFLYEYSINEAKSNKKTKSDDSLRKLLDELLDGVSINCENEKESEDEDEDEDVLPEEREVTQDQDSENEEESEESEEFVPPTVITYEHFEEMEKSLVDTETLTYYLNIPKPNYDLIITPLNRVQTLFEEWKNKCSGSFINENLNKNFQTDVLYSKFMNRNSAFIQNLVKEFEMKKASKVFVKNKISDSGDINESKLSRYMFEDQIFKKITSIPKGKSHGLVFLLDRSGSMISNMHRTLEQLMILMTFCKRVKIPFVVYGFGDASKYIDSPEFFDLNVKTKRKGTLKEEFKYFSSEKNDLLLPDINLREIANSSINAKLYNQVFKNLLIMQSFYSDDHGYSNYDYLPESESLHSGTPFTSALVAMRDIILDFKKKNRLDVTNFVILHDGDCDDITRGIHYNVDENGNSYITAANYFNYIDKNVFLIDKKYNKKYTISNSNKRVIGNLYGSDFTMKILLNWIKDTTGANIIGFFVMERDGKTQRNSIRKNHITNDPFQFDEMYKLFRNENVLKVKKPGFDVFCLAVHNNYAISSGFTIGDNMTQREKVKNFMNFYTKKKSNRTLTSIFIDSVAKNLSPA